VNIGVRPTVVLVRMHSCIHSFIVVQCTATAYVVQALLSKVYSSNIVSERPCGDEDYQSIVIV
jgi:hypothetical protein